MIPPGAANKIEKATISGRGSRRRQPRSSTSVDDVADAASEVEDSGAILLSRTIHGYVRVNGGVTGAHKDLPPGLRPGGKGQAQKVWLLARLRRCRGRSRSRRRCGLLLHACRHDLAVEAIQRIGELEVVVLLAFLGT